ncbi:leucyl/phenylalanyl-tRNA--protein transferase [Sphingomonas sp. HDW15A]|uniref:leucyl/phenylalanyl-tRNA--protein transferase n=1 Tax=Sphingomonas sp. HDW15A TaxID=2714942 RepID=UPI001F114BA8|nr:leucyl/phenylalanyl-tRNA--protein transferase [Sphingomonas sp. HDW15A]
MADSRDSDEVFWVEPRSRAILPLHGFHLSRSLARTIRRGTFEVTRDRAFEDVIRSCADRPETWINADIERATLGLRAAGHAHSIECWRDGELVGGVYGVRLGRAFFGESMFSRRTNASKVALAWLVARLKAGNFVLLDCQFMTSHLASLGATAVPRERYAVLLSASLGAAGVDGSGAGATFPEFGGFDPTLLEPPEFGALERLLEERGAAGIPGAAGQLITQLLGQTS